MISLRKVLLFSCVLKCLGAIASAAAGDLITTFNFGVNDMVLDPTRGLIYATVPSTNSVAVINTSTMSVVKTIAIGSVPVGLVLSPDDSTLYVANSGSTTNAIGIVNLNTMTTLPGISAPSAPSYLAVGSGNRLFASMSNGIMQFDLGTGTYTSQFSAYPYYYSQLVTSPDGNTLFQASEGLSPVSLFKYDISTATATQVQSIMTQEGGQASPLVTPDGSGIIMSNSYTLEELSTSNLNSVIGTFSVGPYTGASVLSSDGKLLYTTAYDSLEIWNANTFVEQASFATPFYPTNAIAVDNSGRFVFAANQNELLVYSTGMDNTAVLTKGALAITQGYSTDVIRTTASGSALTVSPANGLGAAPFSAVSTINVTFTADGETATFDSTNFSFIPMVTISGGTSLDNVVIQGSHVVTFTGIGAYGGGTAINGGVLAFNNSQALGTGAVTLATGTELRGIGTMTLGNLVNFASGTTNAVVSAAPGGLLTLTNLDTSNTHALTFGSAGNTGLVTLDSGPTVGANITSVTVAFGTLANGGGFSPLLSSPQVSTRVNAGAALALKDISTTINSLSGAGSVTLGTGAMTALTLESANFGGVISGAGSVFAAHSLTFTGANTYTGGTTIAAGDSLTLGGTAGSIVGNVSIGTGGSLIFNRSTAGSFGVAISGPGSVIKEGTGVPTLTGSSTYTGGTSITSGALAFSNSNAFGSGQITLSTGAELRGSGMVALSNTVNFASGTTQATISAAPGATFTLNNLDATNTGAITFGSAGNTGTVALGSGMMNNGNAFTVAYGTLRNAGGLTTLASWATTTVNAGATIALNDLSAQIDTLKGAGAITLGSKATTVLTLNGSTFGGVISGMGSVNSIGLAILTGANTYTGGTTIANLGTVQLGNGGTTGAIAGNVAITSGGLLVFDRSNADTFGGVISGAGSVQQEGTGVLTLTGTNTYTGGTQITAGVLAFNNASALGGGPVTLSTGAELRGSGKVTLADAVNFASGTTQATLSAAAGAVETFNNLDTTNTTGVTFGSAGNTGTIALGLGTISVPTTTTATVAFGTLGNAGGLNALTSQAQLIKVNAGATLALNDINAEIASLGGAGAVTLGTKATTVLTLDAANFGGIISGTGAIKASNTTFTGANTYTGGTTIVGGQSLTLGAGGTTGSIMGNVSVGAGGFLVFDRSNADTFAGVISGAGGVTQEGTGVLTLTGNNTYAGGTQVTAGVLAFNNANALGASAVTLGTGTELRGSMTVALNDTVNFATGTTRATLSASTGATFTVNNLDSTNTDALTFGSIGNTGTVAIGAGVTLGANITGVTVAYGTLTNGGGLGLLTAAAQDTTTVNAGATLALKDLSTEIASLAGAGTVTLGTKAATTLTLDSATFGGVISGTGSVSVNGTAIFTGTNTYMGGTRIAANDQLQLGYGTTTGAIAGSVSVGSGAALIFDRSNAYSFGGVISGAGGVKQEGTGVLTFTGSNTYSGGTLVNSGVLAFSNAAALGSGPVTLSNGAELRGSGTVALANNVSFSSGTATATLSAAAGGTFTVNSLDVTNTTALNFGSAGNTGTVVLGSNVTDPNDTAFTVASGTVKNGGGLGTLTSNAPTVTINPGATLAANDFNLTIGNLQGGGALNLGTKTTTVLTLGGGNFGGVISGSGKLTLNGAVTLSGANTYTGGTTLMAGTTLARNTTGSATGTGPVNITGGTLGGSGTVKGAITLQNGTIAPSDAVSGAPATSLHGTSLLWDTGTLQFQIGAKADELVLSGALTKGVGGPYDIDVLAANGGSTIPVGTYTLLQFAATSFAQTDFTLELPNNISGNLIETKTALELQVTLNQLPAAPATDTAAPLAAISSNPADPTSSADTVTPTDTLSGGATLTPAPEPGSALLLACGGTFLLANRRRRSMRAK